MPRVVMALCAAVVPVVALCVAAPSAVADAPSTVYVDAANGSDSNDCQAAVSACQTITQALQLVGDGGTVNVAGGPYAEDLAPDRPVTIAGTDATLDGTLDIHAASVQVSGMTFTGATSPQVHVDDPTASDSVTIHDNTFNGSGTSISVDNNAAGTSITDNTVTSAADGIDVAAGGSDSQYTITGNQFALAAGSGTAIALSAADPDTLVAQLGGNSGTISATGHAITRSGDVTITPTDTPNAITTAGTSLVSDPSTLSLITEQTDKSFDTTTTSDLDLTGARYDVSFAATGGISADEVHLQYSTDGTTFLPLSLADGGASLPAGAGIPGADPATVQFAITVDPATPAGTITLTMTLTQPDTLNKVAGTQVAIVVQPNRAPTVMPQSASVQRNGTVPITLVATDPDSGDTVTDFTVDRTNTLGTVTQSATDPSQLSYTAPANFSGPDTFAFTATDNHGNVSATAATVTVTVGPDTAPSAADISIPASTLMSHAGSNAIDLGSGPSDTDGDTFTYSVQPLTGLTGGTVSVTGHTASYVPAATTAGARAFEYRVWDGAAYSNWAVVSFTVDTPPVAVAQQGLTVSHASPSTLAIPTLTATDADSPANDMLHYSVPTSGADYPSHGQLSGAAPDTLTYTPNSNYAGSDQFRFTVTDGYGASSTALVSITVTDQPPTAPDQTTTIPYAIGTRTIQLDGSDPDSDPVTYALDQSAPSYLSVDKNSGLVTVKQTSANATPFTFDYTVTDVLTGVSKTSTPGTVTVDVNTRPVAQAATLATDYGTAVTSTLQATDPDGIQSYGFGSPAHGHLSGRDFATGAFTYTPNAGYVGTDSFTFTAADAMDSSAPAQVSITVAKATSNVNVLSMSPLHPTSADHPTVTVRVTSAGNESGGVVTIKTGGFGTPSKKIVSGIAKITLPRFPGGPQSITAVFGGTKTTASAPSNELKFTVTKVASRIGFKTNPLQLTTNTRNATATVAVTAGPFRPSGGTVTIDENGNRLAQGTPKVGVVTLHLPRFSLGQHNLTVSYTGTTSIAASGVIEIERVGLG